MKQLPFPQTILFEDDDYFVVNKPPMVSTLADVLNPDDHMLLRARRYLPAAQVGHRLDKGTSGALAFAKHPAAYQHLCDQFAHQQVGKQYHAVAEGIHTFNDTCVEAPITIKSSHKAAIDLKYGKPATTYFNTLTHFWKHTLIACQPLSGRTHQIRLHAASKGAPLVGDLLYGGHWFYLSELKKRYRLRQEEEEQPLMQRVALHAWQLSFTRMNGERITVEAPYVKDFKALLTQLKKCMSR